MADKSILKTKVVNLGDIKPGDLVIGSDGKPKRVLEAYDQHIPEEMYELELENGLVVRASGNHLWYIEDAEDRDFRATYELLARDYFEYEEIPEFDPEDPYYPIEIISDLFAKIEMNKDFIYLACRSLGHSGVTPNVTFDGYMEIVNEEEIKLYSHNNLVKFLHKMRDYFNERKGYFYFGKVINTNEIFERIGYNIYIPTKGEIENGN